MSKYEVNEIVVVKDGVKYYESKILKVECFSKVWKYFVHYQGWKRKWDCWVDEGLVFKKDEDGEEKLKQNKLSKRKVYNDSQIEELGGNIHGKKKDLEDRQEKRRKKLLLGSDMFEENSESAPVLQLQIPLTLKKHMVDEWRMVTNAPFRKLTLPRVVTVSGIVEAFLLLKKGRVNTEVQQNYHDFFCDLKAYFDKALPLVLLYRQEREQYEEIALEAHSAGRKLVPSDIYGVEHLLRLFARIPQLSSGATIVPSDVTFVQSKLLEFSKFIQKNSIKYLNVMDYGSTDEVASEGLVKERVTDTPTVVM